MGAQTTRLTLAKAAVLTAVALSATPAEAAINSVTATPSKVQVATTGASTVAVSWQVGRSFMISPPAPGTIASQQAQLLIGGAVVGTISRRLERTTEGLTSPENLIFRETLQIPRALVYRAIKQDSPIVVRRNFADSLESGDEDGDLLVVPAGPGSAAFSVQRLSLTFDDQSRTRVLSKYSDLRAVVELNTTGVSLLSGVWEVADGSTTAGAPTFRPLTLVRQGVGGSGRTVITSPRLPTGLEGTNLVRFRITNPEVSVEQPMLQYYVTPRSFAGDQAPLREILVTGPRPGEALSSETRFAWSGLPGAEAYHVELFATPAGPAEPADPNAVAAKVSGPISDGTAGQAALVGTFVPGDQTEANLAEFSVAQLPSDRSYLWKVSAIDANGAVIGISSVREIYKP